jgi:hypothetical protein
VSMLRVGLGVILGVVFLGSWVGVFWAAFRYWSHPKNRNQPLFGSADPDARRPLLYFVVFVVCGIVAGSRGSMRPQAMSR